MGKDHTGIQRLVVGSGIPACRVVKELRSETWFLIDMHLLARDYRAL